MKSMKTKRLALTLSMLLGFVMTGGEELTVEGLPAGVYIVILSDGTREKAAIRGEVRGES